MDEKANKASWSFFLFYCDSQFVKKNVSKNKHDYSYEK